MELPDEYKNGRMEVYRTEKAIVKLYFPCLTPEERQVRENDLKKALVDFYHSCVDAGIDWDELMANARKEKEEKKKRHEKWLKENPGIMDELT